MAKDNDMMIEAQELANLEMLALHYQKQGYNKMRRGTGPRDLLDKILGQITALKKPK